MSSITARIRELEIRRTARALLEAQELLSRVDPRGLGERFEQLRAIRVLSVMELERLNRRLRRNEPLSYSVAATCRAMRTWLSDPSEPHSRALNQSLSGLRAAIGEQDLEEVEPRAEGSIADA